MHFDYQITYESALKKYKRTLNQIIRNTASLVAIPPITVIFFQVVLNLSLSINYVVIILAFGTLWAFLYFFVNKPTKPFLPTTLEEMRDADKAG